MTPDSVSLRYKLLFKLLYALKKDQKIYMMMREPNITPEDLKKIGVATTVFAGQHDLISKKETRLIAASIPNAKLRILPGETHGNYIVHSTKIADLILQEIG